MASNGEESCLVPFKTPLCLSLYGASRCGKSRLLAQLLLNIDKVFDPPPDRIVFVYSIFQDVYEELERKLGSRIHFITTTPDAAELETFYKETGQTTLLALDDRMSEVNDTTSGKNLLRLASISSHHAGITLVLVMHSLFHNTNTAREIALNCHANILFPNSRNSGQISRFAAQVMSENKKFFLESFNLATKEKYGYLVCDTDPSSDNKFSLRTSILPGQDMRIFLPR